MAYSRPTLTVPGVYIIRSLRRYKKEWWDSRTEDQKIQIRKNIREGLKRHREEIECKEVLRGV